MQPRKPTKANPNLRTIMGRAVVNLANNYVQKYDLMIPAQFLADLDTLKMCMIFTESSILICILDQFDKRLNNFQLSGKTNSEMTSFLREALLGSIIVGSKIVEDDAVWLGDFLKATRPFNLKLYDLQRIENAHIVAIDFEMGIPQARIKNRVCQLLAYIDKNDITFFERAVKELDSPQNLVMHGFYQYFSEQPQKIPSKEIVKKYAADDISLRPRVSSSIFTSQKKNKKSSSTYEDFIQEKRNAAKNRP